MSDSGDGKKLMAVWAPAGAVHTKGGPRAFGPDRRFAPAKFEEAKLHAVPEEVVQGISEGLELALEGILMLVHGQKQLEGAVGRVQQGVDDIKGMLNDDEVVTLDYACTLLRRAADRGESADKVLSEYDARISIPLGKVEIRVERHLNDANVELTPEARIGLMKQFLVLRHVLARVGFACGDGDRVHERLNNARDRILKMALDLFAELTNGVAVLDVPEVGSIDDERKLLLLMEIIDGVPPDDRRFRMRKSALVLPGKMKPVNLVSRVRYGVQQYVPTERHTAPGAMVRKGQLIFSDRNTYWHAPVSGYLVCHQFNAWQQGEAEYNHINAQDCGVIAVQVSEAPRPGLADLIADLAYVVDYARRLGGEMDLSTGTGELADKLLLPR